MVLSYWEGREEDFLRGFGGWVVRGGGVIISKSWEFVWVRYIGRLGVGMGDIIRFRWVPMQWRFNR